MNYHAKYHYKLKAYSQTSEEIRYLNPLDINLPPGYTIEVFAHGLDAPVGMVFSENGDLFVACSGLGSGGANVLKLSREHYDIVAENFPAPVTGINYMDGNIYVSAKGRITVINYNGSRKDILCGLPCNGDYGISNVAFGPDGKIYFGLGTATNSGVVGNDNNWIYNYPLLHDALPFDSLLSGQNFNTNNIFSDNKEAAYTGAFSPYGVPNRPYELRKGMVKASGSILKANRDGTELELYAWGFRNPVYINFDKNFRLFASNRGYDVRGSRPIANAPDEFHQVMSDIWYGWPDYSAGEPVSSSRFTPEGGAMPEFLLSGHPGNPPKPFTEFPPHSTITGFDFNYNKDFGQNGDIYISEFGSYGPKAVGESAPYVGIGHCVARIDANTGIATTFVMNKSGLPAYIDRGGGFGRVIDVKFGTDSAMYILDMGVSDRYHPEQILPHTGVVWRVTRTHNPLTNNS